jgi:amino acid permease
VWSPIAIAVVALWNAVSCMMIMRCKKIVTSHVNLSFPREISSTYSKIAYSALGWPGVYLTDFSIVFTLLGVCTSYQIAFISLFQDVPFNIFSPKQLAIISAIIVFPMCNVRDVGVLSIVSLAGLVILIIGIVSIVAFGLYNYCKQLIDVANGKIDSLHHFTPLYISPESTSGFATFLGVSVFCFGLCSLAFPVEESMRNKNDFHKAVLWSIVFVWLLYVFVGDGVAWLYSFDEQGVKSNILQNLPKSSQIAVFVRIAMSAVRFL